MPVTPSLTDTTTVFVDGPCASVGVQASTPFVSAMPDGPCSSFTANACVGRSGSFAPKARVNPTISGKVPFVAPANAGARFTSVTTNVKLFVVPVTPSLTDTTTVFVDGPCASVGVQASTPFVSAMPVGPCSSFTASAWVGTSGSFAPNARVNPTISGNVPFVAPANAGARFTSVTTSVKLFVVPTTPSFTETTTVFVDGP